MRPVIPDAARNLRRNADLLWRVARSIEVKQLSERIRGPLRVWWNAQHTPDGRAWEEVVLVEGRPRWRASWAKGQPGRSSYDLGDPEQVEALAETWGERCVLAREAWSEPLVRQWLLDYADAELPVDDDTPPLPTSLWVILALALVLAFYLLLAA